MIYSILQYLVQRCKERVFVPTEKRTEILLFIRNLSSAAAPVKRFAWTLAAWPAWLFVVGWIWQLRKEKLKLTQEKFAELLEVEPRTVQRWEQGTRKPRQEHMAKMQQLDEAK